jgi:plastocyanin
MGALIATAIMVLAAPAAQAAYQAVDVVDGGSLSGVVRFTGTPPRLAPLVVTRDREICGEQQPSEALVVGPDGGVRGSVVFVEGVARGKKVAGELVLDTRGCRFVSHVSALAVGERARVKNSDAVVHNTRGLAGTASVFNVALPQKDQTIDITRRLTRPGVVRVVCDAHPHMNAWIVVHDSPYVAVTDDRGAFRLDGIPAGTYRVSLWHEGFRTISRDITIAPGSAATIEFELK